MALVLNAIGILLLSGFLALIAGRSSRLCTILGSGGAFVGCVVGLYAALEAVILGSTETLHYAWDVPYGSFSVALDPLSAWFAAPTFGVCGLSAVYAAQYLRADGARRSLGPHWFFFNLLAASMALVVVSRNGVLFLVAWEVMSLSSYFLVTYDDEDKSVFEAGQTYLIATHLGTAFLLVFFIVLGQRAGSLDFDAIAVAALPDAATAGLLFVLALVGFGTKAGLIPMHVWLPEAHPVAPSHVSAVMSAVMVKIGIYGLVRSLSLLPAPPPWWGWTLIAIGILSGIGGILFALAQHDLKRLLAYSTVENVGIITLGLGVGLLGVTSGSPFIAVLGLSGALLHVVNHAMFKGLLFLGAGAVLHATGTRELDRLGGLAKRMPWVAAAMIVGSVAIAGLPPLNGFVGEFLIYLGALRGEALGPAWAVPSLMVLAALALIGGLAAVCFTRVVGIALLGEPRTEQAAHAHRPGLLMTVPILVLAAGCIAVGLFPRRVVALLIPVVSRVGKIAPTPLSIQVETALAPLSSIAQASFVLIVLAIVLAVVRKVLLSGREVVASGTWGCGYTGATARMQYTSSSFVQPTVWFFGPVFRTRQTLIAPEGLFPQRASFSEETGDVAKEMLYLPVFRWVGRRLAGLRWLQCGRLHIYILYIGVTLIALLIWYIEIHLQ
jgi:hydrogenase-4 component B